MALRKVESKATVTNDTYTRLITQSYSKRSIEGITFEVVSVMMANVTVEAAMTEMERKTHFLMKVVEEQDHEIASLKNQMQTHETTESNKTLAIKADDKRKNCVARKSDATVHICRLSISPIAARYDHKLHKSSVWRTTTNFFHVLHVIHQENQ
ncbi:ty3-gypsy retrotransposon protein [Cucumis melo var. makuwa]|uniref:Ty3-gypsy retrotransposon protein n=1 Tax=Cucumis melo var. makuwa TaxID=1194695 RepID=A0A5A7UYC9_CUCMM|nr:ty3-gypsy retrotransposon protein [Cucumis melo var. makuwa]TYK08179.1 ty3-gypsy retrotransposon protein [Cucumis melo var. makuwa]